MMRISYNKLWKMLIDKGMKKVIVERNPVLVLLPLLSWARGKTLPQMFCFVSARLWTAA